MKFCINCGTQLPDNAVFCGKCGVKQEEVVPQQSPQQEYQKPMQQQSSQQGYQQPVHQRYPQQGQYQNQNRTNGLENTPFNPSVPSIRFIWPEAKKHHLFSFTPWLNNLNVEINGVKQTPDNGVRFKEGFVVDVPLTSESNRIECWLTTPVVKKKIDFYARAIDLNLDPSYSYIMEIKDPMLYYLTGVASFIKYRIKDTEGNTLFEG